MKGSNLTPLAVSDIIKSQAGVVRIKRDHLAYRLFQALTKAEKAPKKRVSPSKKTLEPFQRKEIEILDKMQKISRESIPNAKTGNVSYTDIKKTLTPHLRELKRIRRTRSILTLPVRTTRKAIRIIKKITRKSTNL